MRNECYFLMEISGPPSTRESCIASEAATVGGYIKTGTNPDLLEP
jgi:hypothetical protein